MNTITTPCIVEQSELHTAFNKVSENNGTAGIDGVTVKQFSEAKERYLSQLQQDLNHGTWQSRPYLTIAIPKKNGTQRVLAIPTVRDRVVHTWLAQKITPILEKQFERCSYGYRPHRSYLDAIKRIEFLRDSGYHWVVDADIKAFFDTISHSILQQKVEQALHRSPLSTTSSLCTLVRQAFSSQQINNDEPAFGVRQGFGIPQGSALSPVLANLYLDELDVTMLDNGFEIVRYADDFVVHCKTEAGAKLAYDEIQKVLQRNKLELNQQKSQITNFELGFTFLGVNFIDQLTLPVSQHTDQCWHNLKSPYEAPQQIDNELNIPVTTPPLKDYWSDTLPVHLSHLNDCIEDELQPQHDSGEKPHPSISQIAKLRTLYIQKQGSVLSLRNGQLRVTHKGDELQRFPASTLDTIWLFGNIHPTVAVIKHCLTHSIPMILLSQAGQRCGSLGFEAPQNPELLRAQAMEQDNNAVVVQRVRFFVSQKLNNQLQLLKRWTKQGLQSDKTVLNSILDARNSTATCDQVDQLRGYEGIGARFYFQQWRAWFQHTWHFNGRNRRPPKDPLNVLLSYGYQLLFNNIQVLLETRGLSPLFGYLHKQANGFPGLALDMMEPWRPIVVDEVVLKTILRQKILPEDFALTKNGCMILDRGRKAFIQAFEQRMQQPFTHPELRIKTDLRRFIDLQILELKQLLLTGKGSLTPLRIR